MTFNSSHPQPKWFPRFPAAGGKKKTFGRKEKKKDRDQQRRIGCALSYFWKSLRNTHRDRRKKNLFRCSRQQPTIFHTKREKKTVASSRCRAIELLVVQRKKTTRKNDWQENIIIITYKRWRDIDDTVGNITTSFAISSCRVRHTGGKVSDSIQHDGRHGDGARVLNSSQWVTSRATVPRNTHPDVGERERANGPTDRPYCMHVVLRPFG
jgi:hypothetical protein